MSWDITLRVPGVDWASTDWNYTSNCNRMIMTALDEAGIERTFVPGSDAERWRAERMARGSTCGKRPPEGVAVETPDDLVWTPCSMGCCPLGFTDVLDGRPGPEGLRILVGIVEQWDKEPDRYREMNPPNGWGDFDGIRRVFQSMIDAATTEAPLVWHASC